ncbi:MAG: Flp pilus assembly protein CpaB [Planctomycetaceae bacterium]|jgi:Flp pilus assembly protein CpaB|nr:Flp pilus assembly protein CpaB [Planctomycetaceae bacterium]
MRTVSWLFLILSFALGIGCAFIVRYYMFEAKPVPIVERQPTIKILVAKQTIPQGSEITAEAITFVEVPITELPVAAITNFSQVYRRRSAYPISIGCPICEDLLLPYQEKELGAEKYIPAGMQIVSLEIEQILLNDQVVEPSTPIADRLSPDQRIDIRMFPQEKSQGEFSERKNQLLKTYLSKNEIAEQGELLLENIEIHQIQRQFSPNNRQRSIQTLTLVLGKDEAAQLTSAARKGRLRIVLHRRPNQTETSPAQNNTTHNSEKTIVGRTTNNVIDKTSDNLLTNQPNKQTNSPTTNPKTDQTTDRTTNGTADNITNNRIDSAIDDIIDNIIDKTIETATDGTKVDTTKNTFLTPAIPAISDSTAPAKPLPIPEPFPKKTPSLLFVPPEVSVTQSSDEIRNDIHSVAATPLSGFYQEKTEISEPLLDSLKEKKVPLRASYSVIEIGAPTTNESEKLSKKNYSPWGQFSIVIAPETETEMETEMETESTNGNNTLFQPLLRNRKKM